MKKILIGIVILVLLNMCLLVINILILIQSNNRFDVDSFDWLNKCDTTINKIRIDSIEYMIKSKDSIINRIKYNEQEYNEKINNLSDTASVELFKRLVSE